MEDTLKKEGPRRESEALNTVGSVESKGKILPLTDQIEQEVNKTSLGHSYTANTSLEMPGNVRSCSIIPIPASG